MGLLGEGLQEQGVHRALESDVQVRDVALCERDDVHAGECESFEEASGVFLVAAEPIERFGKTTPNWRFKASRISAWNPERSSVAPETAWSEYSCAITHP